jgi:hypothetical protein
MTRTRALVLMLAAAATLPLAPRRAIAGDDLVLLVDGTLVRPLGAEAKVAESQGWGVELDILPGREAFSVQFSGWFALGQPEGDRTMRDIYDLSFGIALKPERTQGDVLIPFGAIGLDVLNVTSHVAGGETHRGTTLGLHARGGFMGYLTKQWIYTVSVTYLGAVVPGTGDDLGGLVLQAGLGVALDP